MKTLTVLLVSFLLIGFVMCHAIPGKVCTSIDCWITAYNVAVQMDTKANPCEDFAQYACGGFYKTHQVIDGKSIGNALTRVGEEVNKLTRNYMEEDIKPNDPGFVKKMKAFYQTCLDEDAIERIGIEPYLQSQGKKDWPTLNNNSFDPSNFDLNVQIEKYMRLNIRPIFDLEVSRDLQNSSKHILHVKQGNLPLSASLFLLPPTDKILVGLHQYYIDFATALGADKETAKQDATTYLNFVTKLAKIQVTAEEMIDETTQINPSTLDKMKKDYPYIDWHKAAQAFFDNINKTIPEDYPINIKHPKYFDRLGKLLNVSDKRDLQIHFGLKYADRQVGGLTKELRKHATAFNRFSFGKKKEDPRWKFCSGFTNGFYSDAIGRKFITEKFNEDSKEYMKVMVDKLKTSFRGLLGEASWMRPETKKAAYKKLDAMREKIGYPDKNFKKKDIEHFFQNYTIYDREFYNTINDHRHQQLIRYLSAIDQPPDNDEWTYAVQDVNAGYNRYKNDITFPAGILQPPFYSASYPSSLNYGSIGVIIGHEITHGYDQSGSQFDFRGNLKNWWEKKDLDEYKRRTQCVIDQYNGYKIKEINMTVNGLLSAGENTADIGGLKEAYRAYKAYAATQEKELPLPGLGLTTDQQFFIAFAQLWCDKPAKGQLKNQILSDPHSPSKFRILGPLQNNKDFAKIFKCTKGSFMNPEHKCVVW